MNKRIMQGLTWVLLSAALLVSPLFSKQVLGSENRDLEVCPASDTDRDRGKIYVDGVQGNDDNDGEAETSACRTMERALDRAETIPKDSVDILVKGTVSVPGDLTIGSKRIYIKGNGNGGLAFSKSLILTSHTVFQDICLDFEESVSLEPIKIKDTYAAFLNNVKIKGKPDILYEGADILQIADGSFGSVKDSGQKGKLELNGGTIGTADGWDLCSVSSDAGHTVTVGQGIRNIQTLNLISICRDFVVNGNIQAGKITRTGTDVSLSLLSGKKIMADSFDPGILLEIRQDKGKTKTGEYLVCKRIDSIHAKTEKGYYFIIQDNGSCFSAVLRAGLDSLKVNPASVSLYPGEKTSLKAVFMPVAAQDIYAVDWTSSNAEVASVDAYGNVTARKPGQADLTVKALSDGSKQASCRITVLQRHYQIFYVLNGGTNSKNNPASFTKAGFSLKKPYRRGYEFRGWYADKRFRIPLRSIEMKKNYTAYAKWNKIKVSRPAITSLRNPVSGKLTVNYSRLSHISGYEIVCSRGRDFSSKDKTVRTKAAAKTLTGLQSNKGYYVKVRGYRYDSMRSRVYGSYSPARIGNSIHYHLKRGKNSAGNLIRYFKTKATLKNPVRKGYRFKGWFTNKKCTRRIRVIPKNRQKNYHLYAKWRKRH